MTLSGGEPLLQDHFVMEVLTGCAARGVHTALDTLPASRAGRTSGGRRRPSAWSWYDLKLMDEVRHRPATGVHPDDPAEPEGPGPGPTAPSGSACPSSPASTTTPANLSATAASARPWQGSRQVDLLPHHPGEAKFTRVGMTYALPGTPTPSIQRLEALAALFRAKGLNTSIGSRP